MSCVMRPDVPLSVVVWSPRILRYTQSERTSPSPSPPLSSSWLHNKAYIWWARKFSRNKNKQPDLYVLSFSFVLSALLNVCFIAMFLFILSSYCSIFYLCLYFKYKLHYRVFKHKQKYFTTCFSPLASSHTIVIIYITLYSYYLQCFNYKFILFSIAVCTASTYIVSLDLRYKFSMKAKAEN